MDYNELGTQLCGRCIELMHLWADQLGVSYGALNVGLFVVLEPAIIVFLSLMLVASVFLMKYRWFKITTSAVVVLVLFFCVYVTCKLLLFV